MNIILIKSLKARYFEGAEFLFLLGLIFFILGCIFYYPYLKGKAVPKSGTKRENFFMYIEDAAKILNYHRSIGMILIGLLFIIASIVLFFIGLYS